jgi:hypothetical protein
MPDSTQQLVFKLIIDGKEAVATLDVVTGKFTETGKTGKDVTNSLSKWGMIMTGVNQSVELVRNTFVGLKNIISESVKAATGLEVLRANFKGSAEDLELFRKAAAGTVSESNLIKLSNQASDLGISLKDQAILFSLAEDAADKYGGGVEEGFQRVVYASEGNVKGLKSLGIQKEVYEAIVKELAHAQGGEIDKLDAETQKQIRLQAILKASGQTIEDVKNKTKDNSDKFQALSVRVEEAKVSFGNLIAKGLLPLIDAFDSSGKSAKDVVSSIIGIGGVAFQAIPMLVNLRMTQALLGKQALITAGETTVAATATNGLTGALGRATIATKAFLSSWAIPLAAIAGGVYVLIDAFDTLMNREREVSNKMQRETERAYNKKYATPEYEKEKQGLFGKRASDFIVNKEGTFTITPKIGKLDEGEVKKILDRIKELTDANDILKNPNISIKEYTKNLQEVAKLQEKLKPEIKTQAELESESLKVINKKIGKIEIELLTAGLLNKAKLELLQKSDEELGLILKGNLGEEEKLKVLGEQKKIHDEIKKINDDIIKGGTYSPLPDSSMREERIALQKERIPAMIEADEIIQQNRLKMIEDEFGKRKAEINDEAIYLLWKYSEAEGKRLELEEEFAAARKAIEEAVIIELARLEQQRQQKELDNVSKLGYALERAFSRSGDTLLSKLNQALQIALNISRAINAEDSSVWGIFASIIPGLGFIGSFFGLAEGGPAHAGKMYEVNEKGTPELLQVDDKQFLMMGNKSGYVTPVVGNYTGNNQSAEMVKRALVDYKNYVTINSGRGETEDVKRQLTRLESTVNKLNNILDEGIDARAIYDEDAAQKIYLKGRGKYRRGKI